jgi:hypothetical protein
MQNDIRYKHNGFIPEHYILEVNEIDLPEQYIIDTKQIEYKIKINPISKKEFKKLQQQDIINEWEELINKML